MNHDTFKDLVHALKDGALAGGDETRATEHLRVCPECQTDWARWEKARPMIASVSLNESEDFVARVMARVVREPRVDRVFPLWRAWAAAAVLMVGVGLFSIPHRPPVARTVDTVHWVDDLGTLDTLSDWPNTDETTDLERYFL